MNKSLLIFSAAIIACTLTTHAANFTFVAGDESKATKICMAVAENNKSTLRREIRTVGSSLSIASQNRMVANSLKCNDLYVAVFAVKYNALESYNYLKHYTPKNKRPLPTKGTIRDIALKYSAPANEKGTVILISGR